MPIIKKLIEEDNVDYNLLNDLYLRIAIHLNNIELIKLFLSKITTPFPFGILHTAISEDSIDIVKLLITYYEKKNKLDVNSLLDLSIRTSSIKSATLLINHPLFKITSEHYDSFHFACSCNLIDIVKLIISNPNFDPSDDQNSALFTAYERNYDQLFTLLWDIPAVSLKAKSAYHLNIPFFEKRALKIKVNDF